MAIKDVVLEAHKELDLVRMDKQKHINEHKKLDAAIVRWSHVVAMCNYITTGLGGASAILAVVPLQMTERRARVVLAALGLGCVASGYATHSVSTYRLTPGLYVQRRAHMHAIRFYKNLEPQAQAVVQRKVSTRAEWSEVEHEVQRIHQHRTQFNPPKCDGELSYLNAKILVNPTSKELEPRVVELHRLLSDPSTENAAETRRLEAQVRHEWNNYVRAEAGKRADDWIKRHVSAQLLADEIRAQQLDGSSA